MFLPNSSRLRKTKVDRRVRTLATKMASTVQTVARDPAPSGFPCRLTCRNSELVVNEHPVDVGTMSTTKAAGIRNDRHHPEWAEGEFEQVGEAVRLPRTVADAVVVYLAEDQSGEDHLRLEGVTFPEDPVMVIEVHRTPGNR